MSELSISQIIFADSNIKWDENRLKTYREFMALYNDDYPNIQKILINRYTNKPFKEKSFERIVIQHHDIIQKTLNRLTAGIYDQQPKRELYKGETIFEELNEILEQVGFHQKMYESFHKASFVNLVEFYPAMRENEIAIDILTPESFLIQTSPLNYLKQEKLLLFRTDENNELYSIYWDKESHYKYSPLGDKLPIDNNEEMINPYKVLPLELLRMREGSNFWGQPDWNLFLNQLAIDIKITSMDIAEFFQRIGILHGVNTKIADGTVISPFDLLQSESKIPSEQVSLQYINSGVNFESWKDGIDWRIGSTLRSKGIVGSSASIDSQPTSGYSKEMDERSLKEERDKVINLLTDYEKRCFNVFRKVWNYHIETGDIKGVMIPEDYEFYVEFHEYEPTLQPIDKKIKREMQKQYFIKDEVDFVMEDLGLTEEEATEHITARKQRMKELGLNTGVIAEPPKVLSLRDRLLNATA